MSRTHNNYGEDGGNGNGETNHGCIQWLIILAIVLAIGGIIVMALT